MNSARIAVIAGMLALGACGLKGDLYLPEEETPPATPANGAEADDENDAEDERNAE